MAHDTEVQYHHMGHPLQKLYVFEQVQFRAHPILQSAGERCHSIFRLFRRYDFTMPLATQEPITLPKGKMQEVQKLEQSAQTRLPQFG